MASDFNRGPKIHSKTSLCGEIKYTFKVRIAELYFEAIETNRYAEKTLKFLSLNVAYVRDKLYLLPKLFFQNTIPFWFSIQPEPHGVIDCLIFNHIASPLDLSFEIISTAVYLETR